MKRLMFLATVLLSACVTTSDVVPVGKDSYMVTGGGTGGLSYGKTMVAAMQRANEFCAAQSKFVVLRNTQTTNPFNGESSQVIFSCVTADDPEYKRPDLRKDNGVSTIENR